MQQYSVKIEKQKNKLCGDIKYFLPQNNALEAEYDFPLRFELVGRCGSSLNNEKDKFVEKVYVNSASKKREINDTNLFTNSFLHKFCQKISNIFLKEYTHLLFFISAVDQQKSFNSIIEGDYLKDVNSFYFLEKIKINNRISENEHLCLCWPSHSEFLFPGFLVEDVLPGEMVIMGVLLNQSISEDDCLTVARNHLLQKTTLDKFLRDNLVSAFWFCETDFDAVSLWNKSISQEIINSIDFA